MMLCNWIDSSQAPMISPLLWNSTAAVFITKTKLRVWAWIYRAHRTQYLKCNAGVTRPDGMPLSNQLFRNFQLLRHFRILYALSLNTSRCINSPEFVSPLKSSSIDEKRAFGFYGHELHGLHEQPTWCVLQSEPPSGQLAVLPKTWCNSLPPLELQGRGHIHSHLVH